MLRRRLQKYKRSSQEQTTANSKQTQEELNRGHQEIYEIREESLLIRQQNLELDKQSKKIFLKYYEEVYAVLQPYVCNLHQRQDNLELRQQNVIQLQDGVQHTLLVHQYQLKQYQQLQTIQQLLLKEQQSMEITHRVTGLLLMFASQAADVLLKANILHTYERKGSSTNGDVHGSVSSESIGADGINQLTQEEVDEILRQSQVIRQQNLELREHTTQIYLQLNEHIFAVLQPYVHNLQQRLHNLELRHQDMVQLQYRIRQALLIQQHQLQQKQQLETSSQSLVKEHKVMEEIYKRIKSLLAFANQAAEAILDDRVFHKTNHTNTNNAEKGGTRQRRV